MNNLKVKVILVFSLFAVFSGKLYSQNSIDKIVGIVGENIILESEIASRYFQYKARGLEIPGDMKCYTLEELLYQGLLISQAQKDSIEVTETEITGELERRLELFVKQMGGEQAMEEYFNKTIPEIKNQFRLIIKDEILAQRMQQEITSKVEVSPVEVINFFNKIPKDSLPVIESEYELSEIAIYPEVSQEQNERLISKLEEYRKRVLEGGDDFGTLAIMYSKDPGSAVKNGDIGFIRRTDVVPEFAEAAFSLKSKGDVSPIIKTEYGYHIIQLIEQKGESVNVRHILLTPVIPISEVSRIKTLLSAVADSIRKNQITFVDAVQKYSKAENSKKAAGKMINYESGNTKFTINDLPQGHDAVIKKININELSAPFESIDFEGKAVYKIVLLHSKTKTHVADINTDYQKISNMALEQKKEKVTNDWILKKQKTTYIQIDDSYKNCDFRFKGWLSSDMK